MRLAALVPLALMAGAAPAYATGNASCRGTINPNLRLDLVIGHVAGPVVAQARLSDGNRTIRTGGDDGPILGQSWLDDNALHVDIAEANGGDYSARLRTWRPSGRGAYSGSLRYRGRQYQVKCRVE